MKCLIIEDELPAVRRMEKLLREVDTSCEILGPIESITSAVKWFKNNPAPDLIFMDIQLSDGLCFEIFDRVKIKAPIIFTTAFDQYAIQAFKVNSIDYLLKPINKKELQSSLEKFNSLPELYNNSIDENDLKEILKNIRNEKPSYKSRFLIKSGQSFFKINSNQCSLFKVDNKITHLYTFTGKKYLIDYTLDELSETLDPQIFFRANRQFILNIDAIKKIHTYFSGKLKVNISLQDMEDIIISRARAAKFKSWVEDN